MPTATVALARVREPDAAPGGLTRVPECSDSLWRVLTEDGDPFGESGRDIPVICLNMVMSVDGATTIAGRVGALTGPADQGGCAGCALKPTRSSLEREPCAWKATLNAALFAEDLVQELFVSLSPLLAQEAVSPRILEGGAPVSLRLVGHAACEDFVFLRYRRSR